MKGKEENSRKNAIMCRLGASTLRRSRPRHSPSTVRRVKLEGVHTQGGRAVSCRSSDGSLIEAIADLQQAAALTITIENCAEVADQHTTLCIEQTVPEVTTSLFPYAMHHFLSRARSMWGCASGPPLSSWHSVVQQHEVLPLTQTFPNIASSVCQLALVQVVGQARRPLS